MIYLREQFWAYPMPDAEGAEIRGEHSGRPYQLLSFYGEADAVQLPPGTWEIVCTSKEVTEEQAENIVQLISNGKITGRPQYRRYDRDPAKDTPARSWTRDVRHALETLLTSKGCDLNKNWLILKKQ
jgi:hypothetical protein